MDHVYYLQAQPEVKSFPAEPIIPLVANSEGTYIVGGGISGEIYVWEVGFLELLKTVFSVVNDNVC